jgi:hypothetical protein
MQFVAVLAAFSAPDVHILSVMQTAADCEGSHLHPSWYFSLQKKRRDAPN